MLVERNERQRQSRREEETDTDWKAEVKNLECFKGMSFQDQ